MVGGITRIIMAFSPTLFGSSSRTFIFMYFSIITLMSIMLEKIKKNDIVSWIVVMGAGYTCYQSFYSIIG